MKGYFHNGLRNDALTFTEQPGQEKIATSFVINDHLISNKKKKKRSVMWPKYCVLVEPILAELSCIWPAVAKRLTVLTPPLFSSLYSGGREKKTNLPLQDQ